MAKAIILFVYILLLLIGLITISLQFMFISIYNIFKIFANKLQFYYYF